MGEKPEDVQSIVDRHEDDAALLHQLARNVVVGFAAVQSAAVNPDHHGTAAGGRLTATATVRWGDDGQKQAVFVLALSREALDRGGLRTGVAEGDCVERREPGRGRLRGPPAE